MDCQPLAAGSHLDGNPVALATFAAQLFELSQEIDQQRVELSSVRTDQAWSGAASDAFREGVEPVAHAFGTLALRLGDAAKELQLYVPELQSAQADGKLLVDRAMYLHRRIPRLESVVRDERARAQAAAAALGVPATYEWSAHEWELDDARNEYEEVRQRFHAVVAVAEEAAFRCAKRIKAISHDSLANGGWLDRIHHWVFSDVKNWIRDNSAQLAKISQVLNTASAVLGVIGLLPIPYVGAAASGLSKVAGGIAATMNVALLWAGESSLSSVVVDLVGLAMPAAGDGVAGLRIISTAWRSASGAGNTVETAVRFANAVRGAQATARGAKVTTIVSNSYNAGTVVYGAVSGGGDTPGQRASNLRRIYRQRRQEIHRAQSAATAPPADMPKSGFGSPATSWPASPTVALGTPTTTITLKAA